MEWDTSTIEKGKRKGAGLKREHEELIWKPVKLSREGKSYAWEGGGGTGQIFEEEVYKCGFCKGTGQKPRGSTCSVCRGSGEVAVDPPAVKCAYCKGRGEERLGTNITCTACRGRGIVHVEEPIEKCKHCRGTGAEPTNKLVCISCRGKGVVTVRE